MGRLARGVAGLACSDGRMVSKPCANGNASRRFHRGMSASLRKPTILDQILDRLVGARERDRCSMKCRRDKRCYLTQREIARLMDCARKHGRYGHRDLAAGYVDRILKGEDYRIGRVTGDKYAGEFPRELFRRTPKDWVAFLPSGRHLRRENGQ